MDDGYTVQPNGDGQTREPMRRQRQDASAFIASGFSPETRTSILTQLEQRGGAKIRIPRTPEDTLSAVTLNTAGGLTGDDQIQWDARAGAGSRLTLASAASEKVYRTHGPAAHQHTTLHVETGARLDWLPQETIVFDGARLHRRLNATVAPGSRLLIAEALVLGRQASGECLEQMEVHDRWRVRHSNGRLLHAEDLRLGDDWAREKTGRGTLAGASAIATVLYCDDGPAESLTRLADALHARFEPLRDTGTAAVSALPGRLVARFVADSGYRLRQLLLPCLNVLQDEQAVPRVWHV